MKRTNVFFVEKEIIRHIISESSKLVESGPKIWKSRESVELLDLDNVN